MLLLEHCNNNYESRAKCAEALGVSYQHFNNMIARKCEVEQLVSGKWITINSNNKYLDDIKIRTRSKNNAFKH